MIGWIVVITEHFVVLLQSILLFVRKYGYCGHYGKFLLFCTLGNLHGYEILAPDLAV